MDYRLKDGSIVDDDTLEEMAAAWEGHLENVVVGLPRQDADDLTPRVVPPAEVARRRSRGSHEVPRHQQVRVLPPSS